MTEFTYRPAVGDRIKLKTISDYTTLGWPTWSWLKVKELPADQSLVIVSVMNGETDTGAIACVALTTVEPPLGWKPRYEIEISPNALGATLDWIGDGCQIFPSHDLGSAGRMFYTSIRTIQAPHWSARWLADTVTADQVRDRIQLSKFEQEFDVAIPGPCQYCVGGKRIAQACHIKNANIPNSPTEIGQEFNCFTCNGTGIGRIYLTELKSKERKAAIAAMAAEGWRVSWDRRMKCWVRERSTIVKAWGQELPVAVEVAQ